MKKKYYYNGKLVRTSNNDYPYGILRGDQVVACCGRYDLALNRLKESQGYLECDIAREKKFIDKLINDDAYALEWVAKLNSTKEEYLEICYKKLDKLEHTEIKIVELEARAK